MNKILCLLLVLVMAVPASAGTVSLTLENDIFDYSDSSYTHGTSVMYEFGVEKIKLSQTMYSPKDLTQEEYIEGDRPYAGIALLSYGAKKSILGFNSYVEGGVGVLGEKSFAGDTQKWVHEKTGSTDPKGWDNQVEEGLIVTFKGDIKRRVADYGALQVIPSVGFEVGNLWDYLRAGVEPRIGYNIRDDDFGDHIIQPLSLIKPKPSFYLYGILEGKTVFYNATLEGVKKEEVVYDYGIGAKAIAFNIVLNASHVWRSKEFSNGEEEGYSSITVGYEF